MGDRSPELNPENLGISPSELEPVDHLTPHKFLTALGLVNLNEILINFGGRPTVTPDQIGELKFVFESYYSSIRYNLTFHELAELIKKVYLIDSLQPEKKQEITGERLLAQWLESGNTSDHYVQLIGGKSVTELGLQIENFVLTRLRA